MPGRILIVEDNTTNLELMVYLLQAFGYETCTAAHGLEALSILQRQAVDLIICDLEMPVMDGYSFARQLRAAGQHRGAPLVAVSAYAMVGDREKVLGAGFDGYISKPIDPETFVGSVQSFLPAGLRTSMERPGDHSAVPPVPLPQRVARVLVLDDSPTNLALMRSTLEPCGYEVLSASRIAEAQAVTRQCQLDLIISDLHLSMESGLDFLRWIKQETGLAHVPVIILTSSSRNNQDRALALREGAAKFLNRPIEPRELLAEVKAGLEGTASKPQP